MEFEEVEQFVYLEVILTNKCEETKGIPARLLKASRCTESVNYLIRFKNLARSTKILIKRCLSTTALYGFEPWVE